MRRANSREEITKSEIEREVDTESAKKFILGDIPDPTTLSQTEFKRLVNDLFYNLIVLHNEHLYAETSDQVMSRLFEANLRSIPESSRCNLEALFCDPRFLTVLALLQVRQNQPSRLLQKFSDDISAPYHPSTYEKYHLFEMITLSHSQIWASFVGLDKSIFAMLIRIREEAGPHDSGRLEKLKKAYSDQATEEQGVVYHNLLLSDASGKLTGTPSPELLNARLAESILIDFMHDRINDIYLKTIDLCFYMTDQCDENREKSGKDFNYRAFFYDILFTDTTGGFLRSVQTENPEAWLGEFFLTLYDTLNNLTSRPLRDTDLVKGLDESFLESEEKLHQAIASISRKEIDILRQIRLALMDTLLNSGAQLSNQNLRLFAGNLAKVFLPPFNLIETLKQEEEEGSSLKEKAKKTKLEEEQMRSLFLTSTSSRVSRKSVLWVSSQVFSQLLDGKGIRKERPAPPRLAVSAVEEASQGKTENQPTSCALFQYLFPCCRTTTRKEPDTNIARPSSKRQRPGSQVEHAPPFILRLSLKTSPIRKATRIIISTGGVFQGTRERRAQTREQDARASSLRDIEYNF